MRGNMDWIGIALMSVGLAATQYVLEEGPRNDWFDSPLIACAIPVAVFSMIGFVWREFTAPAPAVNLRLFRDRVFSSATVIGGMMFAILMGSMFLLPVFMQELLGFTALQSGWALVPRTLAMMVVTPFIGRIYAHVPPRLLVALGVIGVALGTWQMGHFTLQTGMTDITAALIVQGIGFAFLFVPLTTVALSHVDRPQLSDASGLNSVVRQFGGSIGLAIFTTLLTRYAVQARDGMAQHLTPDRVEVVRRLAAMKAMFIQRGMDAAGASVAALQALAATVARQAQVIAFDRTFILGSVLMLTLLPLALLLREPAYEEAVARPTEPMNVDH
jgi:DHA2 family multidrug resistance protein